MPKRAGSRIPRPFLLPVLPLRLAFLDLGYLVRQQPVGLPVNGLGSFFVGGFDEAKILHRFPR